MNLRKFLVVVLLGAASAVAAHAQFGVYGTYAGDHLSGIQCQATAPQTCANGAAPGATGPVDPSGFWAGAYYDFKSFGPVRLGLDVRGGQGHSNKSASGTEGGKNAAEEYSFLGGARGSFHTKYSWLRPYVSLDGGLTRSDVSELQHNFDNYFRVEAFGGVDVRLSSFLDLRPVEVGIGNMNRIGNGSGTSSMVVRSIGAGLVLHFPSIQ
jgi:hypothetical protein